jgi:hypothetical protein
MGNGESLIVAMAERCRDILLESHKGVSGLPEELQPKHLLLMCRRIAEHSQDWPATRLHRWIGFVQAGMMANLLLDLDGAKAMFSKLKTAFAEVDEDQDLIDHLDPDSSFRFDLGGEG